MAATQEALYGRLDLALSWSEAQLPERERTKHVHRLHPVPRQVRAAARRGAARPLRRSGRTRPRPVRRIGDDARPVARVGPRSRPGSTSRASTACSCASRRAATTSTRSAATSSGRTSRPPRSSPTGAARRTRRRTSATGTRRAPRPSCSTSASLARPGRVRRRAPRRPRARRALGAADDPLRPRLPPRAAARAVLVPQAPTRTCRPVEEARRFLLRYTLDTLDRIETFAGDRAARRARVRRSTATHASSTSAARSTPSSRRRRIPGSSTTTSSTATRTSSSGSTSVARRSSGALRAGVGREAIRAYVEGVADVLANARRHLAADAPVCIVVNDRRDLYPEIFAGRGFASMTGSSDT